MVTDHLAVDVGANGGFVGIVDEAPYYNNMFAYPMPRTPKEIAELIVRLNPRVAWVEKVSGYIGKAHPSSRMFNFGMNYGIILGLLHGMDTEVNLVRPQTWQKPLNLPKTKDRMAHKRLLKERAIELYPNLKLTLKTCDAALILHYAMNNNKQ